VATKLEKAKAKGQRKRGTRRKVKRKGKEKVRRKNERILYRSSKICK
jgi:hypothetical protein